MADRELRQLERRFQESGALEDKAALIRGLIRVGSPVGELTTADIAAVGLLAPSKVRNEHVVADLISLGWIKCGTVEVTRKPVDCGGWHHCGPECCGQCPACGDDWSKQTERTDENTLLAPPPGMTQRAASKQRFQTMERWG